MTGWTGPKAAEADDTIMLGVDYGTTKAVWCESEAARWVWPLFGAAAALGLLALACFLVVRLPGSRLDPGHTDPGQVIP